MTPEQVGILQTVAIILDKIGTWPVGTLFFATIFGPWFVVVWLVITLIKKFHAMRAMYESNVALVQTTQDIAKDLHTTVVYNTQVMTEVKDVATNNLYCPIVRKETKQLEVDR